MRSGGTAFILPVLCQREVAQITEHRARAFACCVFVQSLVARTFVCVSLCVGVCVGAGGRRTSCNAVFHVLFLCWFIGMAAARLQVELEDAGFEGSGERCLAVVGVLVANQLYKIRKLRLAGDPAKWPGAEELNVDEIIFLSGLGRGAVARSRSRGVCRDGPVACSSSLAATRAVAGNSVFCSA